MQIRHTLRHGAKALCITKHLTHTRQAAQQLLQPGGLSTGRHAVVVRTVAPHVRVARYADAEVLYVGEVCVVAVVVLGHQPLGDAGDELADGGEGVTSASVAGWMDGELGGRGKRQHRTPCVVQGSTAVHKLDRVAFCRQVGDELADRSVRGRKCIASLLAAVDDDVVKLRRGICENLGTLASGVVLTWHQHDFAFGLLGPGEQVLQAEVVGAARSVSWRLKSAPNEKRW
mmetsp:Transcript_8763/g.25111  ORF Transcript_8763/g.25111 Transcript_8763/m.25111 type:complete len:230 (-) Transcript_8763:2-691(-)